MVTLVEAYNIYVTMVAQVIDTSYLWMRIVDFIFDLNWGYCFQTDIWNKVSVSKSIKPPVMHVVC